MPNHNVKNNKLYDYLFHYNSYTNEWNAFKRNEANFYLTDNTKVKSLITDKSIPKLLSKLQD